MTAGGAGQRRWPITREHGLLILLTLVALAVRLWRLEDVPPGWRDDELINSLVISQQVLDGRWAVYYPDASGHEALYHVLNAAMLGLFGPGVPGIRWLSVFLGTLTVPLTYLLGRVMLGRAVGRTAAAALAVSFWSLMYSRIGLRHISLTVTSLLAFLFLWRALQAVSPVAAGAGRAAGPARRAALLSALGAGVGFYTYFASRGVPLILLAFMIYAWVLDRDLWRRQWRTWLLWLAVTLLLALPLLLTLQQQPEAEGRVAELAAPLVEARRGNLALLRQHVRITLSMMHATGDEEWLYNIPGRPLFGPLGALCFWGGVAIAAGLALAPAWARRRRPGRPDRALAPAAAFLLLWWLAGISPAFVSVPPASLGHTILAQPATYLLAALPAWWVGPRPGHAPIPVPGRWRRAAALALAVLFVGSVAARDLPDYFQRWPERGMVRFLYRGDIHAAAAYLQAHPELTDFGITGLLAGPWDRLALAIDLGPARAATARARWYNPDRALLLQPPVSFYGVPGDAGPLADRITPLPGFHLEGGYRLGQVAALLPTDTATCFTNGLCLVAARYDAETQTLALGWWVQSSLALPPFRLISNPPPPGVYAGPRLAVFGQLWDRQGTFLAGDDGLWVDPYTLQPGDQFWQLHRPALPAGASPATAVFGLYDPMTGARIPTVDGRDHLRLDIEAVTEPDAGGTAGP